jgi:chromosome segregation ATPase
LSRVERQTNEWIINLAQLARQETNRLENELLESKKVLIRVKEVMADEKEKHETKITELEGEIKERDKEIASGIEKATELTQTLKEREQAEKEKQKQEKEREAEQARLQGEAQNALLSAERSEIEQLRTERNELRTTTEEQEAFLTKWIKEYERLELDKSVAVHTVLKYGAVINQRDSEIRQVNAKLSRTEIEKAAVEVAIAGLNERVKNLDQQINT